MYIVGQYGSRQIYTYIATPIRIPYKIPNKIIRKSKKNRSDDETENYSTMYSKVLVLLIKNNLLLWFMELEKIGMIELNGERDA